MKRILVPALAALVIASGAAAQANRTIYIAPTDDDFHVYIAAAITKKKVPVSVVTAPTPDALTLRAAQVDQEIVSTGRKVVNCLFAYCGGNENKANTSVQLVDSSGVVVWSYAVNKQRGSKNKQSMAEAIAKHLKDEYLSKH